MSASVSLATVRKMLKRCAEGAEVEESFITFGYGIRERRTARYPRENMALVSPKSK
jgi:hypothetical protein